MLLRHSNGDLITRNGKFIVQIGKSRGEIQCEYRTRLKQKNRKACSREREKENTCVTSAKLKTVC